MRYCILLFFLNILSANIFSQESFSQQGLASFYADKFDGHETASGEIFHQNEMTAAHISLPFGSMVRVTNLQNMKSVDVRINDRGPFIDGRIIDLSRRAANDLGFTKLGVVKVKLELIGKSKKKIKKKRTSTGKPEFYELDSKMVFPKGYGVQIGSFREMVNMMKITQEAKNLVSQKVYVQVSNINKAKIYRVVVGKTLEKEDAVKIQKMLQYRYPECFVVDYESL